MAFEKAMTEHRTPDYRQSLSEVKHFMVNRVQFSPAFWKTPLLFIDHIQVESELKKAEELAYINPEIAEQEKLKGNEWSVLLFLLSRFSDLKERQSVSTS